MPAFLGHRKRLVTQSKPTRIEKQFLEGKTLALPFLLTDRGIN